MDGYGLALILGALAFVYPFVHHQVWHLTQSTGWAMRMASMVQGEGGPGCHSRGHLIVTVQAMRCHCRGVGCTGN